MQCAPPRATIRPAAARPPRQGGALRGRARTASLSAAVLSLAALGLAALRRRLLVRLRSVILLRGQGYLSGEESDGVTRFLDVPFASHAGRWRPPGPPPRWWLARRNPKTLLRCPQPAVFVHRPALGSMHASSGMRTTATSG